MPQKGQVSKAKACVDRHVGRPPRDDGKRAASFGVGVCAACFGDGMGCNLDFQGKNKYN